MEKTAIVIEGGSTATIEIMRASACDGCHVRAENGCVTCDIFGMSRKFKAKAQNDIGAKVGDRVVIKTESSRILAYAALVFLFPIVLGLAFYFVAEMLELSVAATYISSFVGFVLSFVILYFTVNRAASSRNDIKIINIIGNDGE